MKYRIKYNYDSGNSFRNEEGLEGYVEIDWNDLDIAKANLERIADHYRQYQDLNSWSNRNSMKSKQEILDSNMDKDWFVYKPRLVSYVKNNPERCYGIIESDLDKLPEGYGSKYIIDESDAENCIILYTDDNQPFQFWAPWCGYFERLNHAEIEEDKSDRKIKFR